MAFFTIKGDKDLSGTHLLQFDGGAVPNPGSCGSGAVIFDSDGVCLWEIGEYFDRGTNNEAEYRGLELGLTVALREGIRSIKIEGDSKLVISQISGLWKVKAPGLLGVYTRVCLLINKFDSVYCRHVYREFNTHADKITNELQLTKTSFERRV
jgi:ribonuclease HI